jgi:Ca2+-binding EF-hand superfamily protein
MNSIPQQRLVEYAEAFEMFDVEGEGTIPVTQIDFVLRSLGVATPDATVLAIKQRAVDEGEDRVTFTEFLHLVQHQQTQTEFGVASADDRAGKLRAALGLFDAQQTGVISTVDFRKALRDTLKDTEIDALCRKADPAGTGKIAYAQLVTEMTGCV